MNLTRTIKIPLNISSEPFIETAKLYTKAYNYCSKIGYDNKIYNGVVLHQKTYPETKTYLPSQLSISARVKATEALKAVRTSIQKKKKTSCPESKRMSIRYDSRSYTIDFKTGNVSLLTLQGRVKTTFKVPEHYKQYLDWKVCSADLIISRSKKVYLHVVMFKQIADPIPNDKVVGIDRGQNRIAVTSNNQFFGGGHIKQVSQRYRTLRSKLQSVDTKSAKRHLRALNSKENRYRRDQNHCISKRIIQNIEVGTTIVLEDLTHINEGKKFRKEQREERYRWSFFQLEQFLAYKAASKGCPIMHVGAHYTSQMCSCCGHVLKSNRKDQSRYICKNCGFQLNADLNAARNIRNKYQDSIGALLSNRYPDRVVINQPIVTDSLKSKDSR